MNENDQSGSETDRVASEDEELTYSMWIEPDDYEWLVPYPDDEEVNIAVTEEQAKGLIEKLERAVGPEGGQ